MFAMRLVIAVLLLANLAESQLLGNNWASAVITKFFNEITGPGEYAYGVQSSDDQFRGERRTVYNAGTDQETTVVEGYYSYIGLDGLRYFVGYTADENGFHPEGEHLPAAAGVKRRPPQVGAAPPEATERPINPKLLMTILGNRG